MKRKRSLVSSLREKIWIKFYLKSTIKAHASNARRGLFIVFSTKTDLISASLKRGAARLRRAGSKGSEGGGGAAKGGAGYGLLRRRVV